MKNKVLVIEMAGSAALSKAITMALTKKGMAVLEIPKDAKMDIVKDAGKLKSCIAYDGTEQRRAYHSQMGELIKRPAVEFKAFNEPLEEDILKKLQNKTTVSGMYFKAYADTTAEFLKKVEAFKNQSIRFNAVKIKTTALVKNLHDRAAMKQSRTERICGGVMYDAKQIFKWWRKYWKQERASIIANMYE